MRDLTRIESSMAVGKQLEPIIININKYSLEQLKHELKRILYNPDTSVSKEKAFQYTLTAGNIYQLANMQKFLTEIYLSAAGMPASPKLRKK
jgi:hypothetical protein